MLLTLHIVCPSGEDAVSSQEEEAEEDEVEHAEDLVDQRWARARCASHPLPLAAHPSMMACRPLAVCLPLMRSQPPRQMHPDCLVKSSWELCKRQKIPGSCDWHDDPAQFGCGQDTSRIHDLCVWLRHIIKTKICHTSPTRVKSC